VGVDPLLVVVIEAVSGRVSGNDDGERARQGFREIEKGPDPKRNPNSRKRDEACFVARLQVLYDALSRKLPSAHGGEVEVQTPEEALEEGDGRGTATCTAVLALRPPSTARMVNDRGEREFS
jgi:hypothetical protein